MLLSEIVDYYAPLVEGDEVPRADRFGCHDGSCWALSDTLQGPAVRPEERLFLLQTCAHDAPLCAGERQQQQLYNAPPAARYLSGHRWRAISGHVHL